MQSVYNIMMHAGSESCKAFEPKTPNSNIKSNCSALKAKRSAILG